MWLVSRQEEEIWTQREDPGRTQQKGGHRQAKETGLRRNHPCPHLDLGLPASRTGGNRCVLFQPPTLWCFAVAAWANQAPQEWVGFPLTYLTSQPALNQPPGSWEGSRKCKNSHEKGKGSFSRGHPNQTAMAAAGASTRSGGQGLSWGVGSWWGAIALFHPTPNPEWPGSHGLCIHECMH